MQIKAIIFDIDGVLIKADGCVRTEKYKKLFEIGMKMAKSKEYNGTAWMFAKLKEIYDRGYNINPIWYELINPKTPQILKNLSKKHRLYACSMATKSVSRNKLKATGINKYFIDVFENPVPIKGKDVAMVDDRIKEFPDYYYIKFNYGQYKNQKGEVDKIIHSIKELESL